MNAQRASAAVRLGRGAAAVALVGLAAVIAIRLVGHRPAPPATPTEPAPRDGVDLQERVRHQEFQAGRLVADIRGDRFFRAPDGRNHLQGAVEVLSLGPAGQTVSRLRADEIAYDPGRLVFAISGHVRVEAGGAVLEGTAFEYDKANGLFATTGGGRFASGAVRGSAPEVAYAEGPDEVRLGGGFAAELGGRDGKGEATAVSGEALAYSRRERRGRVSGRAALTAGGSAGSSEAMTFEANAAETALESAVLEGGAKLGFERRAADGLSGVVRAGRIAIAFPRGPGSAETVEAGGGVAISIVSKDLALGLEAPAAAVRFGRAGELLDWTASGGAKVSLELPGRAARVIDGGSAAFEASTGLLSVQGRPGLPARVESAEARVEAEAVAADPRAGTFEASGRVNCRFRPEDGGGTAGLFSPADGLEVSSDRAVFRDAERTATFSGSVLARQGDRVLKAGELEFSRETRDMSGRGGVEARLAQAGDPGRDPEPVELSGEAMSYRSAARTLVLAGKASVRLSPARLDAGTISTVLGEGGTVLALSAGKSVTVAKGNYEGRAEAASYEAGARRIILTGRPVLTDGKGGSARGAKLTFDLADDKISIENEGTGRATTVVRS